MSRRSIGITAAFVILGVVGGVVFLVPPAPAPVPKPPDQTHQTHDDRQEPKAKPQPQERATEAAACGESAIQLLSAGAVETPDSALEKRWVRYLTTIQAQGDVANWSDMPCKLYVQNHVHDAGEAAAINLASIQVSGQDLNFVTLTVTPAIEGGGTIVLPAGTLFTAGSTATQNMILADTAAISWFAPSNPIRGDSPQAIVRNLSSYCINRWREVPGADASFQVTYSAQNDPLGKLAKCLERDAHSDHRAKQVAIWLVSDNLLEMTEAELAERLRKEIRDHNSWSLRFFQEAIRPDYPDASDEELTRLIQEAFRSQPNLTPVGVLEVVSHLPEEEAKERLDKFSDTDIERWIAEDAEGGVQEFVKDGGPLLQGCGYDISSYALFGKP